MKNIQDILELFLTFSPQKMSIAQSQLLQIGFVLYFETTTREKKHEVLIYL